MTQKKSDKPYTPSYLDSSKLTSPQTPQIKPTHSKQSNSDATLIPSATVVIIRKTQDNNQLEVLMLRRNSKLNFAGGQWVFPGGRIDDNELQGNDIETAARLAAIRETNEETGLDISQHTLHKVSRWTAPEAAKKRFDTWFYITEIDNQKTDHIEIDGGEIHEFRWMTPKAVLEARDAKEIEMLPPTFITLLELNKFSKIQDALDFYAQRKEFEVLPKTNVHDGKVIMLYPGDIGYEQNDFRLTDKPQHRFIMGADKWLYINTV